MGSLGLAGYLKEIWRDFCSSCHGPRTGLGGMFLLKIRLPGQPRRSRGILRPSLAETRPKPDPNIPARLSSSTQISGLSVPIT